MIHVSVRHDFDRFAKTLDRFGRTQLPFATARALTTIAKDAGEGVKRSFPVALDRPTPFTRNSLGVTPAKKTNLQAVVFIKDKQAAYLSLQEQGGERTPKKKALVLPVGVKLNQYGNMPRNALARARARKDTFSGTVRGVGGIWQRTKDGGLKLLAAFRPKATYKPRLGFMTTVEQVVSAEFPRRIREAMAQAMRTARR